MSKAKQGIDSPLPITAIPRAVGAPPSHVKVTWEHKHHHSDHPHILLLLLPALYTDHGVWNVPLVTGVSCPGHDPPCDPQPLQGWGGVRSLKDPDSVQELLSNNQTLL